MPTIAAAITTAEHVIRDIIAAHPEKPIRAKFYRGMGQDMIGPIPLYEHAATPAADGGWFVQLNPGLYDTSVAAMEPDPLGGYDVIGNKLAGCLDYPRVGDEVDLEALAGPDFRHELLAAIDEKIAAIEAARA